jgi:hypothetical protein
MDAAAARRPLDLASLPAVGAQLDRLLDEVGMGEDFLVTALVGAVDEYLRRTVADRERNLSVLRALRSRFRDLDADPASAAAYLEPRGLGPGDLEAALAQLDGEIERLMDPGWPEARRRELEAWGRATAGLVDPERRRRWEEERFQAAGQAMIRFFTGTEG